MTENIFIFAAYSVITGSITCAIILLINKIVYNRTSAAFMKYLMGFGLISFVLPSYMIYFLMEEAETSFIIGDGVPLIVVNSNLTEDIYNFLDRINIGRILTAVWATGIVIYMVCLIINYIKTIRAIKKYSTPAVGKTAEIFKFIEKSERVILLMSKSTAQPYTIGVRRKYIVFPVILENILSDKEIRLILMHELTHIEKNDAFLKIFIEILNGINWFNPFFYKIKKGYCFWTEADCDETLNQDFDEETRRLYANLLIKVAEINIKYKNVLASFLALKRKNSMTRREELIMKNKKKGTKFATVAMSFMALCVFCGAGYAAKEADYAVYGVFGENKAIVNANDCLPENELYNNDYNLSDDVLLIGGESSGDLAEPKHIHKYVDTTFTKHKKNKDGSCDVTYYEAKKCTVCDKIINAEVVNEVHFKKCIH